MAGQLKKLFDAEVTIGDSAPADAVNVINLGTRASCPVGARLGDAWPQPSPREGVLKSIDLDGKKALLAAGGGSRAVLSAAYRLGEAYGIRYVRFGDLYPATPPHFTLR